MPDTLITLERPAMRVSASTATGGAGVCLVSLNIRRVDGPQGPQLCTVYLSDAANGAGLTAVTATGAVAQGASGILIGTALVASKAFNVQTTAAGLFILSITDTAKTPFVVCVELEGRCYPITTLATASYG
jgi:hypothetical protein